MTNPGTIRWNTVPSKYLARASATSDAAACGDVAGHSRTLNLPQLVRNSSVHCRPVESGAGRACLPGLLGPGLATSAQPPAGVVGAAAVVSPPPLLPTPQPAQTRAAARSGVRAVRRVTAGMLRI